MDVAMPNLVHEDPPRTGPIVPVPEAATSATASLKRSAAEAFEDASDEEATSHKKIRDETRPAVPGDEDEHGKTVDGSGLADNLEEELQCGCCSAIVYRPVVVAPCQHFFCGSCVTLWIRNGGTSCPACRTVSTSVSFSRPIEKVVDILLRHAPGKARSASERMQADAIYHPGVHLRIPSPRQASPEPTVPSTNSLYVRPCPHCTPGNQWGWRCPRPIVDPDLDQANAWHVEDGNPPGHALCGNCENVLALTAPSTTRCDFCQVSFCGINIPQRCVAAPLQLQHPHGLADLSDLIQCGEIYDCFEGNTFEVDIMLDYLNAQGLTPRHIYREIVAHIQNQPRQFAPLVELELFVDIHPVAGGVDPDPNAPRHRICRICATEVLLYGLRDWWVRERKKGFLEEHVMARPDCPEGSQCPRQKDHVNHIIAPPELQPVATVPVPAPLREPDVNSAADFPPLASAAPAPGASRSAATVTQAEQDSSADADEPEAPAAPFVSSVDLPVIPQDLIGYSSAPSSQDFRDEVDALL
ncbi:hypothetical protein C8T65DRAFT_791392 [Cerioporus squamosus]|nr:hypothetical protein C8T65DRAFT_791392 [Cerioporus squamosus]